MSTVRGNVGCRRKEKKGKLSIADEEVRLNDDGYLLFADLIQCK